MEQDCPAVLADICELCGPHMTIKVRHIRVLKGFKQSGRAEKLAWVKTMAARHYKTLVVCRSCHKDIHQGRPRKPYHAANDTSPESQIMRKHPVWFAGGRWESVIFNC